MSNRGNSTHLGREVLSAKVAGEEGLDLKGPKLGARHDEARDGELQELAPLLEGIRGPSIPTLGPVAWGWIA